MTRFVSGEYSLKEPVALMVGILMAPRTDVATGLRRMIAHPATAATQVRFAVPLVFDLDSGAPLAVCGFGYRGGERVTVEFDPLGKTWPA